MSAADVVAGLGRPLRVAVIGAGPSGFYATEHLMKSDVPVEVDLIDRLATPYGLVRGGVAPDHQKIKSVTKAYERIATSPGVRFYGLVEFGTHVTLDDLRRHYDVVLFTVGAPHDRRMGIDGEDLTGSISATDFVAWYNGHPDYRDLNVDLSVESAVVIGAGNVAIDVARILVTDPDVLAATDIADHALEALRASRIRHVTMLARRGPAQAAFTPKELRELGELDGVTFVVDPAVLDHGVNDDDLDQDARRNLDALAPLVGRTPAEGDRVLEFRFLVSPTALSGDDAVEAVEIVENELVHDGTTMRPRATDRTDTLPAGLVLRAVGYRGAPLDGVAFDDRAGVVPHDGGRILDAPDGAPVVGLYTAGGSSGARRELSAPTRPARPRPSVPCWRISPRGGSRRPRSRPPSRPTPSCVVAWSARSAGRTGRGSTRPRSPTVRRRDVRDASSSTFRPCSPSSTRRRTLTGGRGRPARSAPPPVWV